MRSHDLHIARVHESYMYRLTRMVLVSEATSSCKDYADLVVPRNQRGTSPVPEVRRVGFAKCRHGLISSLGMS